MATEKTPAQRDLLDAAVRLPQHVVYRVFPAETVVLNLDTGKYHSLNRIGGRFMEVLEGSATVREALARLTTEFGDEDPAEIERDLCEFCADLAARGLIDVSAT